MEYTNTNHVSYTTQYKYIGYFNKKYLLNNHTHIDP